MALINQQISGTDIDGIDHSIDQLVKPINK